MNPETLTIEVLICTHNRVKLLQQTLNHINNAVRPENCALSLLVIANACTDETHAFLQNYQDLALTQNKIRLTWLEETKPGKSNALNTAIPNLEAQLTAMVDDDHRVDCNYFMAIYNAFEQFKNADFFCGKIIPDWNGSEPHWVHEQGKYRIYPLPVPRFDLGETSMRIYQKNAVPGGGNLVIKTDLFKKVGFFSTQLGPTGHNLGGGEDYDWVVRAYNANAILYYVPDIVQFHYVDNARLKLTYLVRKSFERTSSVVQLSEVAKNHSGLLFPKYLLKKSIIYLLKLIFSFSNSARRFYFVRLAAALGEINGFFHAKNN